MRLRQRLGLRIGIAILSCGSVLLAIALHRMYAAFFGQHVAFAVFPLALVGAGLGGLLPHLASGFARPSTLLARVGHLACLAALATLAALLIAVHVKSPDALDRAAAGRIAALGLAPLLPYLFLGPAFTAAFRHAGRDAGRLGFTAFAAAAITGPLAVAVLRVGAPRTVLVVLVLDALAALGLYLAARFETTPVARPRGAFVATALLASSVLFAGDLGAPWLKIPSLRWGSVDRVETQEWTALGLITVDKASGGAAQLRVDGTSGVPIHDSKAAIPALPMEIGFVLHREPAPVLVVGAGGGREVRVAEKLGQKEIEAIEPNGFVVRKLMRDRYKKYSGEVFDRPGVTVSIEDPRVHLRRTSTRYRTILYALPDTQAPSAVGALAADPAALYTVEALRDALDRLTPDGALVVSRWDTELDRLFATLVAALRSAGITDPAQHLYGCSAGKQTAVLVTRASLAPRDVSQLRSHCRRNKHNESFAPDLPHSELRRALTTAPDVSAVVANEALDISPPTDDRPFFFWTLRRARFLDAIRDVPTLRASGQAVLVLVGLLTLVIAALVAGLSAGLSRPPRDRERGARLAPLAFFMALSSALVIAGVALGLRIPVLLGHPGHALTTVLVALLAFAGGGSLLGWRVPSIYAEEGAGYRGQVLAFLLALVAIGIGPFIGAALGLPTPVRFALGVVVLAPIGFLFGALPALGLKLVMTRTPELVPFSMAVAMLAAALSSVITVLLLPLFGASAALLVSSIAALVAAAAVPRQRRAA